MLVLFMLLVFHAACNFSTFFRFLHEKLRAWSCIYSDFAWNLDSEKESYPFFLIKTLQ